MLLYWPNPTHYLKQNFQELCEKVFKTYSYEDNILIFKGVNESTLTPIKTETWFDIHKEHCDKFFDKYGIDNVKWMVL